MWQNKIMKKIKSEFILEVANAIKSNDGFIKTEQKFSHRIKQTDIKIIDENIAKKIGRDVGDYICLNFDELLFFDLNAKELLCKKLQLSIKNLLNSMKLKPKKIMIVGLGNEKYACDSLGKRVTSRILVTKPYLEKGLYSKSKLAEVYSVSLGVYGTTGIDSSETIKSLCEIVKPNLVLAIDSLVAENINSLGLSIQISNTKLSPGGGVGNNRQEVSEKTLGTKVLAIGVPLVADISNITKSKTDLIVTPKDVEQKVGDISKIIAKALNLVFNNLTEKELLELTN